MHTWGLPVSHQPWSTPVVVGVGQPPMPLDIEQAQPTWSDLVAHVPAVSEAYQMWLSGVTPGEAEGRLDGVSRWALCSLLAVLEAATFQTPEFARWVRLICETSIKWAQDAPPTGCAPYFRDDGQGCAFIGEGDGCTLPSGYPGIFSRSGACVSRPVLTACTPGYELDGQGGCRFLHGGEACTVGARQGTYNGDGVCVLEDILPGPGQCPDKTIYDAARKQCIPVNGCPAGQYPDTKGTCVSPSPPPAASVAGPAALVVAAVAAVGLVAWALSD